MKEVFFWKPTEEMIVLRAIMQIVSRGQPTI